MSGAGLEPGQVAQRHQPGRPVGFGEVGDHGHGVDRQGRVDRRGGRQRRTAAGVGPGDIAGRAVGLAGQAGLGHPPLVGVERQQRVARPGDVRGQFAQHVIGPQQMRHDAPDERVKQGGLKRRALVDQHGDPLVLALRVLHRYTQLVMAVFSFGRGLGLDAVMDGGDLVRVERLLDKAETPGVHIGLECLKVPGRLGQRLQIPRQVRRCHGSALRRFGRAIVAGCAKGGKRVCDKPRLRIESSPSVRVVRSRRCGRTATP